VCKTDIRIGEVDVKVDPRLVNVDFSVSTPTATSSTRGTHFLISHNVDLNKTTVTVIEGIVGVKCLLLDLPEMNITAGQRISVDESCFSPVEYLTPEEINAITKPYEESTGVKANTSIGGELAYNSTQINLKDARVYEYPYLNWNNANWGAWDYLALKSQVDGISDTRGRIYIWFDPALLGNISQDQSLHLQLVHWPTEQEGNMTANIFPVTEPWEEGNGTYHPGQNEPDAAGTISWSRQPAWEEEMIWASQELYPSPEPYNVSWNITGLARAWISGKLPNYGLVIVGSDEGAASYSHILGSSNNPDPALRQRILIEKATRSSGTEGQEANGGQKGLSTGSAILRDWDATGDKFSFDNGTCAGCGYAGGQADLFIASREKDPIIHVFESPGIIDLGEVDLAGLIEASESGYKENEPPVVGHTYVTKSRGKYGAIRLTNVKLPPEVPEAEYTFDWIYQPDGSRNLGSSQV